MVETQSTRSAPAATARRPGLLLALFGVLLVAAISQHPAVGSASRDEVLRQIVRLAWRDEAVHAVVIAVAVGLLTTLSAFSSRRGNMPSFASTALTVYSIGVGGTIVAAMIDGFLVPAIAARYVDATPETLSTVLPLLNGCALAIQIATKLALIATAVAIAIWSITLLNGSARIAGVLGLAAALVAAFVLALTSSLDPHSLGAIVLPQVAWYVWVGGLMAKGEL